MGLGKEVLRGKFFNHTHILTLRVLMGWLAKSSLWPHWKVSNGPLIGHYAFSNWSSFIRRARMYSEHCYQFFNTFLNILLLEVTMAQSTVLRYLAMNILCLEVMMELSTIGLVKEKRNGVHFLAKIARYAFTDDAILLSPLFYLRIEISRRKKLL